MKRLVKAYEMEEEQAKEKWQEYCQYLRDNKDNADATIKVLKDIYYQLSQGRQVIDIYESMKTAGKNEHDQPRLAICRADLKEVIFEKRDDGAGAFWNRESWSSRYFQYPQVAIPAGVFNDWRVDKIERERPSGTPYILERILEPNMSAPVPIVPAEYRPDGRMHNYFILWEVEKWENAPPRDPFLLRRLSSNLFVVLAAWDLTELERAVMKGAIL